MSDLSSKCIVSSLWTCDCLFSSCFVFLYFFLTLFVSIITQGYSASFLRINWLYNRLIYSFTIYNYIFKVIAIPQPTPSLTVWLPRLKIAPINHFWVVCFPVKSWSSLLAKIHILFRVFQGFRNVELAVGPNDHGYYLLGNWKGEGGKKSPWKNGKLWGFEYCKHLRKASFWFCFLFRT